MQKKTLIILIIFVGCALIFLWGVLSKHALFTTNQVRNLKDGWYQLTGNIKFKKGSVQQPPYLMLAIGKDKFFDLLQEFGYSGIPDLTDLNIVLDSDNYFIRFIETNSASNGVGEYSMFLQSGQYYICASKGVMGPGLAHALIKSCAKVSVYGNTIAPQIILDE